MTDVKNDDDNVTDIGKARKKKGKRASEDPGEMREVDIQLALSNAIRRLPEWVYGIFPVRYEVLEPAPGTRLVLHIDDDEVASVVPKSAVRQDLIDFVQNYSVSLAGPWFLRTHKNGQAVIDLWMDSATPIASEAIKMTRWKSEPGLTYRRLPWDQGGHECPTWEGVLGRMTNNQAFIDWIGSLLVEDSSLHGYVWLYGPGGDGKGAINRFLAKVFGQAYRSKQPPAANKGSVDKFWTYGILGARLVVFPDCDNASFTTGGLFKSLTGGDPVDVEAKGSMSFTTIFNAKYLIISNEKPTISSEKSDLRRIIYCEMESPPATDPGFEKRLWEEGGAFLTQCLEHYLARYQDRRAIEPDAEATANLISDNEQYLEDFFNEYFYLDENASCLPAQIGRATRDVWGNSRKHHIAFLNWLKRRHGIASKACKVNGKTVRQLHGLAASKWTSDAYNLYNGQDPREGYV